MAENNMDLRTVRHTALELAQRLQMGRDMTTPRDTTEMILARAKAYVAFILNGETDGQS